MNKRFVLACIMTVLICMLCGCSNNTDMTVNQDGSGIMTYRVAIDKDGVENTEYTNFDTLEELAQIFREKIDPETGIEVSTDKTSSANEDYLLFSYKFKSIEDLVANIDKVIMKYNQLVVADDYQSIIGYDPNYENNRFEIEALVEYMKENGIEIDANNRNVRKFVKIVNSYISTDGYFNDSEFRKKDEDYSDVKIVKEDGTKVLKVNSIAFSYISMYIRRVAEKNNTEIFNNKYIEENAFAFNGKEAKEILKRTLTELDFANVVKKLLDEKYGGKVSVYSMNDFSVVMTINLFTEEYARGFNEIYQKQYEIYQESKQGDTQEYEANIKEELYKDRDTFYNVSFGENKVSVTRDDFFELMVDGYLEIPEKASSASDLKEHANVDVEGLDEAPLAGDNFKMVLIMLLAGISLMGITAITINKYRR